MSFAARSLALVGLLLGCELTAELGVHAAAGETSTSADTDTSVDMDADADGTGDGESGEGEGEGEGDGDGDGEPGDGDGDGVCMIDGSEDPCRICLEHLCCEQLGKCDDETGCFCMLDCLADSDPVTCATTCTPGLAYFQLLQCQAMSCAAVCE